MLPARRSDYQYASEYAYDIDCSGGGTPAMPERFTQRILDHLTDRRYEPKTVQQLAVSLQIDDEEVSDFREAVDQLIQRDQVVLGARDTIGLPPPGPEMIGTFRKHERGFGFIVPDELFEHGDLFVPPHATGGAMTGDRVKAKVIHDKRRAGGDRSPYTGKIVDVLQRAEKHYVGTLFKKGKTHLVDVDGRVMGDPVIIRDVGAKNAKPGQKVVIDLVSYPEGRGELAEGVIVEVLGEAGEPDVETQSVIRAYGLREKFPTPVIDEARRAAQKIDEHDEDDREDLTDVFICTIDPPDAKDFDDAINIEKLDPGREPDGAAWSLGVHIADVAHYIPIGSALDEEAYERGNSAYLPRRVIPMLPEVLSNGVCSLQPGVNRLAKSCFIRYDAKANVLNARFARSIIESRKRLTYLEAQALIDGNLKAARKHVAAGSEADWPSPLIEKLKLMDELAKTIRKRRFEHGMVTLDLPEVELIYDDSGRVIDAEPEDDAFTHTIIEMFMVEANEAAARLFDSLDVPMIRRTHPDPDAHDTDALRQFARVAGYNIPKNPSRKELQTLLDAVRGKPAQHAVHLAVLRTLSKAEYSPKLIGHFALGSDHYTHFTSPIRRYPDLVVHRGLDAATDAHHRMYEGSHADHPRDLKRKQLKHIGGEVRQDKRVPDEPRMAEIGKHCSTTERNAESAERELREYLVLELLAERIGDDFAGTVTGVTGNGIFVQVDRYLVDGFIHLNDLPGSKQDRWRQNPQDGSLRADRSGRRIAIGDRFTVRVASVDTSRRQMELTIIEQPGEQKSKKKPDPKQKKPGKRNQPEGARKSHQKAMDIKRTKKKGSQKKRKRS